MTDQERIAAAINWIKKELGLKDYQLAKKWGVDKNTVAAYCEGKGIAKGQVLASLVKDYGVNGEWLIAGQGDPFLNASETHPTAYGPPGITQETRDKISTSVREVTARFGAPTTPKINIDDAQGKVYRILSAGTALSVALYMNIQQFAAALDTGQELKVCQDQMKEMQTKIDALTRRVDGLTAVPTTTADPAAGSDKEAM